MNELEIKEVCRDVLNGTQRTGIIKYGGSKYKIERFKGTLLLEVSSASRALGVFMSLDEVYWCIRTMHKGFILKRTGVIKTVTGSGETIVIGGEC